MVPNAAAPAPMVDVTEASQETALAEGNSYNVVAQEAPLKRNVVVSIKSTLNGEADLYGLNFYSFTRLSSSCFIEFRFHTHLYTRRPLPPAPARHLVAVRRGPPRHLPVRVPSSVSNSTFVYECICAVCLYADIRCMCMRSSSLPKGSASSLRSMAPPRRRATSRRSSSTRSRSPTCARPSRSVRVVSHPISKQNKHISMIFMLNRHGSSHSPIPAFQFCSPRCQDHRRRRRHLLVHG